MEIKGTATGAFVRELIARITSDSMLGTRIKNGELRKRLDVVEPKWSVPAGYDLIEMHEKGCKMELFTPKVPDDRFVLLQLHGGGYVAGMRNAYRNFAKEYSDLGGGIRVLTPDYRIAPEHTFPAALEDALAAYDWLKGRGWNADEIIIAGDSAGGGLALALCLYLKMQNRKMPAGIIAMSPWTDMTAEADSYARNYHNDPNFGNTRDSLLYNREYAAGNDPHNPFLSPLFGDYHGFPPMLIQVGGYEMLLDDSVNVAKKAKKAGVKVRLSVYDGMFHVFQMGMRMMPESRKAWNEVHRFLDILRKNG